MTVAHAALFVNWLDTVVAIAKAISAVIGAILAIGNLFTHPVVAFFWWLQLRGEKRHGELVELQKGWYSFLFPIAWIRFENERNERRQKKNARWR